MSELMAFLVGAMGMAFARWLISDTMACLKECDIRNDERRKIARGCANWSSGDI